MRVLSTHLPVDASVLSGANQRRVLGLLDQTRGAGRLLAADASVVEGGRLSTVELCVVCNTLPQCDGFNCVECAASFEAEIGLNGKFSDAIVWAARRARAATRDAGNARLREALESIATCLCAVGSGCRGEKKCVVCIAKAALEEKS